MSALDIPWTGRRPRTTMQRMDLLQVKPSTARLRMGTASSEQTLPPPLVLQGSDDDVVPFEQSVVLGDAMVEAGHRIELYRLDGAGHGAGAFFGERVMEIVDRFLRESFEP
jgi:acetyl esterase/lipase